jgi:hypothetical protein
MSFQIIGSTAVAAVLILFFPCLFLCTGDTAPLAIFVVCPACHQLPGDAIVPFCFLGAMNILVLICVVSVAFGLCLMNRGFGQEDPKEKEA